MTLDLVLTDILTSLAANGLTALTNYGINKVKFRESINKAFETESTIKDAMANVAKLPIFSSGEIKTTMLKLFLESPTTESIVRQIYSDSILAATRRKSIEQIQKEFKICLVYHLKIEEKDVAQLSDKLFEIISIACNKAFDFAINKNLLSAHEAKSIARHSVVMDEIQAIKSNLHFLEKHSDLDVNAINDFEKKYRIQVGKRHCQITIPHFDKAPKIDINKIFTSPRFVISPKKKGKRLGTDSETIDIDKFFTNLYRVVLLGDPGGGKSTLAQKICYELCENYKERLIGGRLLTPVLVTLREYSAKKKQEDFSIIQFMENEVTSKYQFSKKPPINAFEYLINNGHFLVIFDGLDELLDPCGRQEISADIESFCNLFPSAPVLVTSRTVGYEQAPLDPEYFEMFYIAPFNDEQVSDYAQKWFIIDALTFVEGKKCAETFIKESHIVSDLRSNPLMLALMCNLYRGAGFIPHNRPGVYKKCSEMLLERWDTSRGIWTNLPIPEPKSLLGHLAYWIYSEESLQSGIPEDALIKEATKFLLTRRFETEEEAEKAAKEFIIKFCRGRAWVFADVGTTPKGISLYQFTHKTFLEYFTATNVVRNNNTPDELWNLLSQRIEHRIWDVVSQLAFQILDEQVEGAADKLLLLLIEKAKKNKTTRCALLSFGARCLQFIYPSPKTIRLLTEAIIKCVIENGQSSHISAEELIGALLFAAPECRQIIADSIQTEIIEYVHNADDNTSLRAMDLGLMLTYALPRFEKDLYKYWDLVEDKIFKQIEEKVHTLASKYFLAFRYWFFRHDTSIEKLFEWYGPDYLFTEQKHLVFKHTFSTSLAAYIFTYFSHFDIEVDIKVAKQMERVKKITTEIGKILLNKQLPCFFYNKLIYDKLYRDFNFYTGRYFWFEKTRKGSKIKVQWTGDIIIGMWCLLASISETVEKEEEFLHQLKKSRNSTIKAISNVIEGRMHKITPEKALEPLKKLKLPLNALPFVEQWITGKISFVSRA